MVATWTTPLAAPAVATPGYDADRAYVLLRSGELSAVSLVTGAVVWTVPAAGTVGSPEAGDGLVFLAAEGRIEARDAATGAPRWKVETKAAVAAPVYWNNGWLLAFTADGTATMYRAATGDVVWRQALGAPVSGRPTAADTRVYVLLRDGRVLALALGSGATQWEAKLPGAVLSIRALDDRVFVGCADKYFYCLAAKNGKTKWRWRAGAVSVGTPSVDERFVYFVALDGVLRALDRGNGSLRWQALIPNQPSAGPFLSNRRLLVPGIVPEVPAYSTRDGKPSGTVRLPADPSFPPGFVESTDPGQAGRLLGTFDDGRVQLLTSGVPLLRGTPLPGPPYAIPPLIEGTPNLQALIDGF